MPRPRKRRCCRRYRGDRIYKLRGVPLSDCGLTELALDEFEALRLCDAEGLDQTAAGDRMGVSRGTIQRLLAAGRRKLVTAILSRDAIAVTLTRKDEDDEGLHSHAERHRCGRRGV